MYLKLSWAYINNSYMYLKHSQTYNPYEMHVLKIEHIGSLEMQKWNEGGGENAQ